MLRWFGLDWRISLLIECGFYIRVCRNWRQVVAARLHQENLERFVLRNRTIIAFDGPPPLQIFQEIWRRRIYTREYPRSWRAPRVIVDIGANVGFFSFYAAQAWDQAEIFAYEPAPENFKWLCKNIQENHATRIHAFPFAVASASEERSFYLKGEAGWHSLWASDAQSTVRVQTTALEKIVEETGDRIIDFLKMDCEGAEYEVLAGREALMRQHVRFIAMEYHESSDHRVAELEEILTRAHFACTLVPEPDWRTGLLYGRNAALAGSG